MSLNPATDQGVSQSAEVIVVGGGLGGLACAALLSKAGCQVLLLEKEKNPGGCAASFQRHGLDFDAGATLGCGFQPGGALHWLGQQLAIDWPLAPLSEAWHYLDGHGTIAVNGHRQQLVDSFAASQTFWQQQHRLANQLWPLAARLLDQYHKPLAQQLAWLSSQTPSLLRLALQPAFFRPASSWLRKHQLHDNQRFCRFIDAQLLISAQTQARHCTTPFAALALDLPRQQPCHIQGGMGQLAQLLVKSIGQNGGQVVLELVDKADQGLAQEIQMRGTQTEAVICGFSPRN